MMLAQLSCAVLAAATIQFCPQPRMRVRGFWGEKLDLLERNWMPECARLDGPSRKVERARLYR